MPTLMKEFVPAQGKRRRRCDGTCHRAKSKKCHCICEGKYHGKGDAAALAAWQADWKAGTAPRLMQGTLDFKPEETRAKAE